MLFRSKQGIGRSGTGCYHVSSWELVEEDRRSQSFARKELAVGAGAKILREAGVKAHGMARLD